VVTATAPGRDEIVVTTPDGATLCHSLGCRRAGRAAQVIATFGTLNDPGAGYHDRGHCGASSGAVATRCAAPAGSRPARSPRRTDRAWWSSTPARSPRRRSPEARHDPRTPPRLRRHSPRDRDGDDDARWQEAARLRAEHRGWIVIWLAPKNCYRAYCRLPGARRDTALSAATAAEMAAQIGQAEEAGTARPARRGLGTR